MVELDVQLTRDRRLIVFHDDRLERTTNGTGRVQDTTYATLRTLDAGRWFHPRFAEQRILLLSQALRVIGTRMRINLELKRTARRHALVAHVRRCINRSGLGSRILLSSFDSHLLRPFVTHRLSLALICRTQPDRSLRQAIRLHCAAWHPFHALVTRKRITMAHAANLRVHVWTVDDPQRARQLMRWGVDGIFTNHPAHLITRLRIRDRR